MEHIFCEVQLCTVTGVNSDVSGLTRTSSSVPTTSDKLGLHFGGVRSVLSFSLFGRCNRDRQLDFSFRTACVVISLRLLVLRLAGRLHQDLPDVNFYTVCAASSRLAYFLELCIFALAPSWVESVC